MDLSGYPSDAVQPRFGRIIADGPRRQLWRLSKPETAIQLVLTPSSDHRLRFSALPEIISTRSQCRQVDFALNGQVLKTVIFSESWGDYDLSILSASVNRGSDQLTIRFDPNNTGAFILANAELHRLAPTSR